MQITAQLWEHVRELLCLHQEVLALEKAGCCQTSITDVLPGETACCGLHSFRACPLSCSTSCSKIEFLLGFFFPLHIVVILQLHTACCASVLRQRNNRFCLLLTFPSSSSTYTLIQMSFFLFLSIPVQFELLTSMKSLHKHIDSSQLPLELEGTFPYCHQSWLSFRRVSTMSCVLGCLRVGTAGTCQQLNLQALKDNFPVKLWMQMNLWYQKNANTVFIRWVHTVVFWHDCRN